MRKSRLICGLSLALAFGTAYGASLPWEAAPKPEPAKYVLVRMKSDQPEDAARAVAGIGRLDGRLRGDVRIRVKLDPGVSLSSAMQKLNADGTVAYAMEMTQFDEMVFSTVSVEVLEKRVQMLKQKAESLDEEDRERLEELEQIRRDQIGVKQTFVGREGGEGEEEEVGEGLGLDYYEAREYHIKRRAYPNDTIDTAAYYRAVEQRDKMAATEMNTGTSGEMGTDAVSKVAWEFIGPRNLDAPYNIYFGTRPAAGRVNTLAFQPSTPSKIYAGAAGGGLWKSNDAGVTWEPLGDQWPFMNVSSIAVQSFGQTLYVGTGDFDGWGGYGFGLMKSVDGGSTWTQLGTGNGFQNYAISDVLISPDNPDVILVTLGRGNLNWGSVYRSTNGGTTWTQVIGTAALWSDLSAGVQGPSLPRYIWAGASGGLLYRSSDQGATWTQINGPFNTGNPNYPLDVVASTVSRNTVFVMDNVNNRVYKSTDAGSNWTDITGNLDPGPGGYNFSQSWYDTHLTVVRRNNQDALYAGLVDIQQCTDLNGNWRTLGFGFQQGGEQTRVHVDHHAMAFHPTNPDVALVGSDGGVYRFVYNSAGDVWSFTGLSANLGITQFYAFDVHPTNPDIVIGGTQDNSTPYSMNGDLANWENVAGGDGGYCAINPADPNNMYATSQYLNVYRTDNNWSGIIGITPNTGSDNVAFIAPIELDYNAPDNLYAGTNYLWRYNKSTNLWTPRLGGVDLAPGGVVSEIVIAPGASNRIYVGTNNGRVWYSNNSGSTWTQINTGTPNLPNRYITSISVNPSNINDILVGLSGTGSAHLYRCPDVTAVSRVWTDVDGSGLTGVPDIPLNDVIRDPDDVTSSWHVATDVGVFTTFNGGSTWTNSTNPLGLPNVQCNMLKLQGRNLFVATFGRGIWRVELPTRLAVSNLTLNKSSMEPGNTATGTVTLASAAPAGGAIVALSSNHASLLVPATVTVPSGASTVNFTATCVNVSNKQPSAAVTVTASRPGSVRSANVTTLTNYATYISDTMTDTVFEGERYPTWIDFKNSGGATWDGSEGYEIVTRNPTLNGVWGLSRIPQNTALTIAPQGTISFHRIITAPTTLGTYSFQWSPNQTGVGYFDDWGPNKQVQVLANPHGSVFVSQTVPTTVEAGNEFPVQIRFTNTGTTTWSHADQFWLFTQWKTRHTKYATDFIRLPGATTVAPGASYTFNATLTAPVWPQVITHSWRVGKNYVGFGDWSTIVNQTVTTATDNAMQLPSLNVPSTVAPGAQFTASIVFKNLGTNTWTPAGGYEIESYWPQGQTFWGTALIPLPAGSSIATNQNATFTHTFTAPTTPGTYHFQWRMKKGTKRFGQWSPAFKIVVQ